MGQMSRSSYQAFCKQFELFCFPDLPSKHHNSMQPNKLEFNSCENLVSVKGNVLPSRAGSEFGVSPDLFKALNEYTILKLTKQFSL